MLRAWTAAAREPRDEERDDHDHDHDHHARHSSGNDQTSSILPEPIHQEPIHSGKEWNLTATLLKKRSGSPSHLSDGPPNHRKKYKGKGKESRAILSLPQNKHVKVTAE